MMNQLGGFIGALNENALNIHLNGEFTSWALMDLLNKKIAL